MRSVAELLDRWLADEHDWKPGTWRGYRTTRRRLGDDPLLRRAPAAVTPPVLRAAMHAWSNAGVPTTTVSLNVRTLRSAFGWAHQQRLLASQPLAGLRGPGQPEPRRDVPLDVVRELLTAADLDVHAAHQLRRDRLRTMHRAEQVRLLLRLAADTGARRGELDSLQFLDLHGRVLHIDRGVSDEVVTTTRTRRTRRVTLGATTAALWDATAEAWRDRHCGDEPLGPWLFSAEPDHSRRLRASTLSHWFAAFVARHGYRGVCLHALRHTVATVLVSDGHLLQASNDSVTPKPAPPCGSTATPYPCTTSTPPTTSTGFSTSRTGSRAKQGLPCGVVARGADFAADRVSSLRQLHDRSAA